MCPFCQVLHQEGYISYMRTESKKYSQDFLKQGSQYIEKNHGQKYIGDLKKIENNNNNPHEAIRVTNIGQPQIKNANTKIVSLYKLIWKTTLESMMCHALWAKTSTFYEKDVAASTTATGRQMIMYAKGMVEEMYGYTHCDTYTFHGPILLRNT